MTKRVCLHSIILVFAVGIVHADVPATQPQGPRETFQAFFAAIAQGRPDDIAPLCLADDADSRVLVNDLKLLAASMGALRTTVAGKFGADAVDSVSPQLAAPENIDAMKQTIAGDRAELMGENIGPVKLIKSDGRWKIDIAALRQSEGVPDDPHGYFTALAACINRTAADIQAGRLDSPASAAEALLARQDGIDTDKPSTRPTTAP